MTPASAPTDPTPDSKALRALPVAEIMRRAHHRHLLVPAFNIPYLPMVEPILAAVAELRSFALVQVARPDIERFQCGSYQAVAREFRSLADLAHARLHQDHVPVIDEEGRRIEWRPLVQEALDLGYHSVMIDGSRLPLAQNIAVTREVVKIAHPAAAVEAELGAVLGHEPGPLPPYEELFRSGRGFTDPEEAARLVTETAVDWLSVAIGNIHGAIIGAARDQRKVEARLHLEHLRYIQERVRVPLVLHGGTGIQLAFVLGAARHGIAKINIGTAPRQAYETTLRQTSDIRAAQQAAAKVIAGHLRDYHIVGSALLLASPV